MPLLPLLLQLADPTPVGPPPDAAALVSATATRTRAELRCQVSDDPGEVVVCAGRDADNYRVPLMMPLPAGDPRIVDALGERHALLRVPQLPCGVGAFLANCGMVGVRMSTRDGISTGGERPLAP